MLTSFQQPQEAQNNSKIKVVYYNNLESNFAIKQFKSILEQHQILDYFLFEQVSSPEQFEAKLIMSDYDILLNTINIGLRKDILKILTTDDVLTNPSRYTNTNLTNLFKQYSKSPQNIKIAEQINGIFAQDMPFVIVGRPFSFVNIKKDLILPSFLS